MVALVNIYVPREHSLLLTPACDVIAGCEMFRFHPRFSQELRTTSASCYLSTLRCVLRR